MKFIIVLCLCISQIAFARNSDKNVPDSATPTTLCTAKVKLKNKELEVKGCVKDPVKPSTAPAKADKTK